MLTALWRAAVVAAAVLLGGWRLPCWARGRESQPTPLSFAPTSGHRGRTVFIDPGHGGPDPGAVGVTTTGRSVHEAASQ